MASRTQVYAALDSEREYQNFKWHRPDSKDPAGHNPHSITEWLSYMQYYVNEGLKLETLSFQDNKVGLDFLRKVAALGVAGMEQHGAPVREGF